MDWVDSAGHLLWQNALTVLPLAAAVALLTRFLRFSPATRHNLWLVVLLWFVAPALLPRIPSAAQPSLDAAGPDWASISGVSELAATPDDSSVRAPLDSPVRPPRIAVAPRVERVESRHAPADPPVVFTAPRRSEPLRRILPARPADAASRQQTHLAERLLVAQSATAAPADERAPLALERTRADSPASVRVAAAPPGDVSGSLPPPRATTAAPQVSECQAAAPAVGDCEAETAAVPVSPAECDHTAVLGTESGTHLVATPPDAAESASSVIAATSGESNGSGGWSRAALSASSALLEQVTAAWAGWVAGLELVRTVMLRLPALPPMVWVGGSLLLGCLLLLRVALYRRCIQRDLPAPSWVSREVARVAKGLGVRRVPRLRMVDASVSPMVWPGLRPELVLPLRLWASLDRVGRRAILCHELAHLKRRDHWVRWVELLITLIYWWHPLMWWVRRRLGDEADLSCDAWVTWLMPQGRRAYAEALLQTNQFCSEQKIPTVGMAVATPGARTLSRRLTMVMTQTARPRLSMSGAVLVLGVALCGWMSTPALSCPPKDKEGAAECEAAAAAAAAEFALHDDEDQQAHEKQARKASEALAKQEVERAKAGRERRTNWRSSDDDESSDETIVRVYALPPEKRERLLALLIRDDVPIRVRPVPDGIQVHAGAKQHEVVKAFVEVIRPEYGESDVVIAGEKGDMLYQLLALDDVQVIVSRNGDEISIRGTDQERDAIEALIQIIDPDGKRSEKRRESRSSGGARGTAPAVAPLAPIAPRPAIAPRPPLPPSAPRAAKAPMSGTTPSAIAIPRSAGPGARARSHAHGPGEDKVLVPGWRMDKNEIPELNFEIPEIDFQIPKIEIDIPDIAGVDGDRIRAEIQKALEKARGEFSRSQGAVRREVGQALQKARSEMQRGMKQRTGETRGILRQAEALQQQADRMRENAERLRERAEELRERIESEGDGSRRSDALRRDHEVIEQQLGTIHSAASELEAEALAMAAHAADLDVSFHTLSDELVSELAEVFAEVAALDDDCEDAGGDDADAPGVDDAEDADDSNEDADDSDEADEADASRAAGSTPVAQTLLGTHASQNLLTTLSNRIWSLKPQSAATPAARERFTVEY